MHCGVASAEAVVYPFAIQHPPNTNTNTNLNLYIILLTNDPSPPDLRQIATCFLDRRRNRWWY